MCVLFSFKKKTYNKMTSKGLPTGTEPSTIANRTYPWVGRVVPQGVSFRYQRAKSAVQLTVGI